MVHMPRCGSGSAISKGSRLCSLLSARRLQHPDLCHVQCAMINTVPVGLRVLVLTLFKHDELVRHVFHAMPEVCNRAVGARHGTNYTCTRAVPVDTSGCRARVLPCRCRRHRHRMRPTARHGVTGQGWGPMPLRHATTPCHGHYYLTTTSSTGQLQICKG